jgi:hypothetical protein
MATEPLRAVVPQGKLGEHHAKYSYGFGHLDGVSEEPPPVRGCHVRSHADGDDDRFSSSILAGLDHRVGGGVLCIRFGLFVGFRQAREANRAAGYMRGRNHEPRLGAPTTGSGAAG